MGKAAHSVRISDRQGGMSGPNGDEWLTFAFHLPSPFDLVLNGAQYVHALSRHCQTRHSQRNG